MAPRIFNLGAIRKLVTCFKYTSVVISKITLHENNEAMWEVSLYP